MKPDLYIERPWEDSDFDTGLYPITPEEFHEIATAEGYVKLDVDVEALREVVKDRAEGWPMGNSEIETLISAAYQVLAALDREGDRG